MSSHKTHKWSSSASLTKMFSRITRTLSFASKKKNRKIVQQPQSNLKNILFVPKSVPVIRRHPSQPTTMILYNDNKLERNRYCQGVHVQMYDQSDDEEEDYSRYSLRPNLSLLNVSMDNLHYQQVPQEEHIWLDDVFHSTKIKHY